MKTICSVLVLALMGGAASRADEPWEGRPLSTAQREACRPLPRALVRAVLPSHRRQAEQALGSAPAVVLSDSQAAAWTDTDAPKDGALADRLLADAVILTDERRVASYGEHGPKWSPTEQWMFETLMHAVEAPHRPYRPVLVRAVAGFEPGGTFDAAECDGALAIRHLSHGAEATQAAHVPVVVFVEQPPVGVKAWRETAKP